MSAPTAFVVVPREQLEKLKQLEKRLYSEQRMDADEMRDWANWINQGFMPSCIDYE